MTTKVFEVYKCSVCGNTVLVVGAAGGSLVCCGQPMVLQQEKTADQGKEKHVPVVEKTANGILVKVGSVPHPMEEKHYIQWVEVCSGSKTCMHWFKPGDKPEAEFPVTDTNVKVREFCSVHGLWTNKA
ncbi:MAG: desulfoferrodoxin [Methanoregula sp.]|jgi:superoxide reductase